MDEIIKDFLIESGENLDRLNQDLVKLESAPSSKELLAGIFRTIHTIKGSCGFLGFARMEKVAHAGESLLSLLRDGDLSRDAKIASGLLAMVDAVRSMLAKIQSSRQDGEEDYSALIERLAKLQARDTTESEKPSQPAAPAVASEPILPGCALIASGDFHMVVQQENGVIRVSTHQGPRENFCRPLVDVLFRSVANVYGARSLAIVLTSMGQTALGDARCCGHRGREFMSKTKAAAWSGLCRDLSPGQIWMARSCHCIKLASRLCGLQGCK